MEISWSRRQPLKDLKIICNKVILFILLNNHYFTTKNSIHFLYQSRQPFLSHEVKKKKKCFLIKYKHNNTNKHFFYEKLISLSKNKSMKVMYIFLIMEIRFSPKITVEQEPFCQRGIKQDDQKNKIEA